MSSGATFQLRAVVPAFVKVTDEKIICNSTAGYELSLVRADGTSVILETYIGATIKDNPFERKEGETWKIVAL